MTQSFMALGSVLLDERLGVKWLIGPPTPALPLLTRLRSQHPPSSHTYAGEEGKHLRCLFPFKKNQIQKTELQIFY